LGVVRGPEAGKIGCPSGRHIPIKVNAWSAWFRVAGDGAAAAACTGQSLDRDELEV